MIADRETYFMELNKSDMALIHEANMGPFTKHYQSAGKWGKIRFDLPYPVLAHLVLNLMQKALDYDDTEYQELGDDMQDFAASILYSLGVEEAFLMLDNRVCVTVSDIMKPFFMHRMDKHSSIVVKEIDFPELLYEIAMIGGRLHDEGKDWM